MSQVRVRAPIFHSPYAGCMKYKPSKLALYRFTGSGMGNTEPCPSTHDCSEMAQYRSWCFTVNNYSEEEYQSLLNADCKYIIIGKEVGEEEKTEHLQGYVQFKNAKTLGGVKKINGRAHWEQAKGNAQQNYDYCSKGGKFEERGVLPKNGKRTASERAAQNKEIMEKTLNELVEEGIISIKEVRAVKNARYDLAQEGKAKRAEGCRGIWIWGPPGVGKTHKAKMDYPEAYIKQQNKWWDGYMGQKYVVLEDFDNPVLGHYIKIWADKWECTGEVKGAVVNLQHDKFIITSNYHPSELWKVEDDSKNDALCKAIERRFEIIFMGDRDPENEEQREPDDLEGLNYRP